MKKFLYKSFSIAIVFAALIAISLIAKNYTNYSESGFKNMPLNNASNSVGFNAKMDFIVKSKDFKDCTFLIAGSSLSLNNISGELIEKKTNEKVFNISSFGFKSSNQLLKLLNALNLKKLKTILIAFNNTDFGCIGPEINYKLTERYLNSTSFSRNISLLYNFNIRNFSNDWELRNAVSNISNDKTSLNFDKTGSVLLNSNGFSISKINDIGLEDTTGLNNFITNIEILKKDCNKRGITLMMIYLPSRFDLLSEKNILQNKIAAKKLTDKFKSQFYDTHDKKLPNKFFYDGSHMFKEGAESITNSIIDSLHNREQKIISNQKSIRTAVI